MREITLEELLEAGCHFGHQVTRSNPKARDFIFEARDSIHIIDLARTKEGLEEAGAFVKNLSAKGGSLVVVGTKRQARGIVEESFKKAKLEGASNGLFYITNRWVGGFLTNFHEVSKNFKKYHKLLKDLADEDLKAKYTKKEIGGWDKERRKLEVLYGGIANITKVPDVLFIIDSHLENLAVREAIQIGIPTVAIVDTNADPNVIDYPIPANDDAVGSIKLIVSYIIDAWIEGRKRIENKKTATTETQNVNETLKSKSDKKTATTEALKGSETQKRKKIKNVSKK